MAGDQELQLKVTLVDQASPQLKQLRDAMNHLNQQAGAGHKAARGEAEALGKELTKLHRQIKEVGTALGEMKLGAGFGGLGEVFRSASNALGGFGRGLAGFAIAAYAAKKTFDELNTRLDEFANKINTFGLAGRSIGVSGGVIDSISEQLKGMGINLKEGEQAFSNFIQNIAKVSREGTPEFLEVGAKFKNPEVMRRNIEEYRREINSRQYSRALTEAAQNINKRYQEELRRTGSSTEATLRAKDTADVYGIPVDVARRIAERTAEGKGLHDPDARELAERTARAEKLAAENIEVNARIAKAQEEANRNMIEFYGNWIIELKKIQADFIEGFNKINIRIKGPDEPWMTPGPRRPGQSGGAQSGGAHHFFEPGSLSSRLDPNLLGEVDDRTNEHQDALQENTDQLKRLNDFLGAPGGAGLGGALGLLGGAGGGLGIGRGGVGGLGAGSGGRGGMAGGPGGIGGGGNLGTGSGAEERFGVEGKDLKWYHSMMPKGEEALFKAREKFDDELKDPAVRDLFDARMANEVGGQGPVTAQKFAEEVFNRALSRKQTIREALEGKDKYYPSVMTSGNVTEENRKRFDDILQKAKTSNLIKWGTGNASRHVGFGKGGFETSRATPYRGDGDAAPPGGGHTAGNVAGVMRGVNPRLLAAAQAGAAYLPEGYTLQPRSGLEGRQGQGWGYHPRGMASDWIIVGPNGPIPNRGDDTTGLYTRWARGAYTWALQNDPELAKHLGWGGAFGTTRGSTVPDLMHLDLGGHRGRLRPGNILSTLGPFRTDALKRPRNAQSTAAGGHGGLTPWDQNVTHQSGEDAFDQEGHLLDRSAFDRAANPFHAKITGGADINVNVAAPPGTSVTAKRRGIFRKQTVSRQTQMQPAQSGPSMSEETVP